MSISSNAEYTISVRHPANPMASRLQSSAILILLFIVASVVSVVSRSVAPTEANKAETVVPEGLTTEEVESSVVELGDITPDETKDFDVVVVGAGAAGVPAAGWAAELGGHVALLQKQSIVVSQGNCGSAIIKSKSTEAGKKMWVHMTNGLCDWRADTSLLNAYVENSEEALMWYLNRAGLTDQTEYGDGSLVDSVKDPSSLLHNDDPEIVLGPTSRVQSAAALEKLEGRSGFVIARIGSKIIINGTDKQKVGQFAAEVRGKRPPEP